MKVNFLVGKLTDKNITQRVLKESVELLKDFFDKLDLPLGPQQPEYSFVLVNGARCTLRQPKHRCRFVRFAGHQLLFKLRPGDNSTAWEWWVTPEATLVTLLQTVLQTEEEAAQEAAAVAAETPGLPGVDLPDAATPPATVDPPAPLVPTPATAPPATTLPADAQLLQWFHGLQAQAQAWLAIDTAVHAKLDELQALENKVDVLRDEITALEAKQNADVAGREAADRVRKILELMGGRHV